MDIFNTYFKELKKFPVSEVTEQTYRAPLQNLLNALRPDKKIDVLHEPKRKEQGAPDYKVMKAESIIGYVENKKIEDNLSKTAKSKQIEKYKTLSDNILLTNYIEWIWIKDGKLNGQEVLCFEADLENKRSKLDETKAKAVEKLIKNFFSQAPKEISDAKKLAEALAIRAKILKDLLQDELESQHKKNKEGKLFQLYEVFKKYVFQELTLSEFADAFAQNLVYGLFLAKLNANAETVTLENVKRFISSSFELIRELVDFLDELERDEYRETKWIVEEVLTIINNMSLEAIHNSLSFKGRKKDDDGLLIKDPYVYFYEDFLSVYDKKLRESKGVYYTPPPVVNFIVRAIDDILVDTFGIKDGLADKNKVTVLDFAVGTGTFLVEILQQIFDKLPKDSARKELLIKEHILKNIYGFEYLIAPYTLAHLKLSQFLEDNGHKLKANERFQVYLTNTLEPSDLQEKILFLPALTEESNKAQEVKDKPILVITGNPPYSIHSKNNGDWIRGKVDDYKNINGIKVTSDNPKGIQDDYVKFIRFAQDKMENVDEGVVGIITNHTFLFSSTFPGMRKSLMDTFNRMYFINLHGNAKLKERTPEGGKDENVFDIEQGVSISIFVKKKDLSRETFYFDSWGTRKEKYVRCLNDNIKSIEWKKIDLNAPYFLFQPYSMELDEVYRKYWSILDIFDLNSSGIKTHRDHFAYSMRSEELKQRIKELMDLDIPDEEISRKYNLKSTSNWTFKNSRKKFSSSKQPYSDLLHCQYRPFDLRTIFLNENFVDRPRTEVMKNFNTSNLGLISGRAGQVVGSMEWNLVFVTNTLVDVNLFYRGGATVFPLFIYNGGEKTLNFTEKFVNQIFDDYKSSISAVELLGYIYSILHSSTYREKYAEFLKIDFPRIPFTENKNIFKKLAELGNELIQVHLLEEEADYSYGEFIGKGDYVVEKPVYKEEKGKGRLYINKTQYFDDIPKDVYEFYIGGYQVMDKYLKDRKGRKLGLDEVDNVAKTVRALAFTIDQMKKIDELTKDWI